MLKDAETIYRFLPDEQRKVLDRISALTGLSRGATIALSLSNEAIRDYCPPEEASRVAMLVSLASAKR